MTVLESLMSQNAYPVPSISIEKICVDRELDALSVYTKAIADSQAYQLATADLLMWLHDAPSIVEQEVGVNNAISIKQDMAETANKIYAKYNDAKFNSRSYGYIGEKW